MQWFARMLFLLIKTLNKSILWDQLSMQLTDWGRVTHVPSGAYMRQQADHHWYRLWLFACSAPSYYLNQFRSIVNSNLRNKLQWNLKQNTYIFIQKMHLKMSSANWCPFGLNECGLNVVMSFIFALWLIFLSSSNRKRESFPMSIHCLWNI